MKRWKDLRELTEAELRTNVMLPLLSATPGLRAIHDVHGINEKGLDIIFFERGAIEDVCYGLQLKAGDIKGGGTGRGTVKEIIDQLGIAESLTHPVAIDGIGKVQIDRFIVATSGVISHTARDEIASRTGKTPITFWDGVAIERRIRQAIPELFSASDGAAVVYLKAVIARYQELDALDQIPGVAKRTLPQVYEEPSLRRRFAVPFEADRTGEPNFAVPKQGREDEARGGVLRVNKAERLRALQLTKDPDPTVVIGDQDAGKTALLRMLAITSARASLNAAPADNAQKRIPIVLRCKAVVAAGFNWQVAITQELATLQGDQLATSLDASLRAGSYLLLVDGFSELGSQMSKDQISASLEAFQKEFPSNGYVVAGRPVDFITPKYFQTHRHYVIEEFDQRQVGHLLNKWTSDSPTLADVAKRLTKRVREALQLPGSPISATIGVMLYEKEHRYITNTAEAVDRYMVIRLGRYANELGIQQEVEWTRKQDILAEIALEMVEGNSESIPAQFLIERIDQFFVRIGEDVKGKVVLAELLESGVLIEDDRGVFFHRTAFRDFFAAHGVLQQRDPVAFMKAKLLDKRWGLVLVFAAGLRRKNADLINALLADVEQLRSMAIDDPGQEYFYAAYLLGRILSNSETTDADPRMGALREVLQALQRALPAFVISAKQQFGNIGEIAALIGTEHTFLSAVGVPWLENQFSLLVHDASLTDEQRYLALGAHSHLGGKGSAALFDTAGSVVEDTRVLLALKVLAEQIMAERNLTNDERDEFKGVLRRINRRLSRPARKKQASELTKIRSKILALEAKRIKRITGKS